jgi:hypothetical protein
VAQTETGRVDLKFTKDSRILAGVSGAVTHMAEVAGMEESRRAELVAALEDALQAAFHGRFKDDSPVEMTLAAPAGHIEVVLTFHGDSADGKRAKEIQVVLRDRLDRIALDVSGGTSRITLVKDTTARTKKR